MASLALSIAGTAIGGPIGGAIGGMIGGMLDNILFPAPTKAPPAITSSTYGTARALAYGPEVRLGCNMIWTSGWRKSSEKSAKLAQLKGAPPQYVTDCAFACGAGPWQPGWVIKIFANGNVLFDSTVVAAPAPDANGVVTWTADYGLPHGSQKDFDSLVIYPGNNLQLPDPTIEAALGMGEAPAYRGTAYFVINGLRGTPWGNSVPTLQILASPQAKISVGQIITDMLDRCGLDTTLCSTSGLTSLCKGFFIDSQTDGVSALQPLALVFNFDIAEVGGGLRFSPRGESPLCTIENFRLAGHAYGDQRPTFEWPRDPDLQLPKIAALTFIDPARDCQANTQSERRATGSSQSNISTSVNVTLTSDEGRAVAARMLWEAHVGRQTLSSATDDRMGHLEAGRTYAVEVPFGYETVRITDRTRGANQVIEFTGSRDLPDIYSSNAPGASASVADNGVALGGPANPPIFIEPPSGFPGLSGPTVLIAISGGDGATANAQWGGCNVYVSTDDVTGDYQLAGVQIGPSVMGKVAAVLAASGGRPDTVHTLKVDTSESGGEPASQSPLDAQDAQMPYMVGDEFLTAEVVSAIGGNVYNLTRLWRGLYGTDGDSHSIGEAFVRLDSAIFRFALSDVYIGRTLYFRFVSVGETLANATTYTYTPTGIASQTAGATQTIQASQGLATNALVNIWNSGGSRIRNANATGITKPANGFVRTAVLSGANGLIFTSGATITGLAGLTPGATYYLDTSAGGITPTPPAVTGEGVQVVGTALDATSLLFQPGTITAVP
ncbi:MAG TPA: phage tail protein [Caulobacteraceae bacterium]